MLKTWLNGQLVECSVEEFIQGLRRYAGWAAQEFGIRSDPAAHLGGRLNAAADRIEADAKVIAALMQALDRHDRWLAKAADALNVSLRMSDMDLGSEITQYRRANEQSVGEK